jgi:putative Holliday junction resolvase
MSSILALDIGEKRVGVALAEAPIYLSHPIVTLQAEADLDGSVQVIIKDREVVKVVVGYPRNQEGKKTKQTEAIEVAVKALNLPASVELVWQDESLTSVKAKEELEARGKPFEKGDVDALAATYILEDYLRGNK